MRGPPSPSFSLYTPAGRRKYLTPDERARFIAAARACQRSELKTFCLTLAYTGCRISEGLAILPHAVEAGAGFIAVKSLKKRNGAIVIREIPVPADLFTALDEVHRLAEADPDRPLWGWCRSQAWLLVKSVMRGAEITPGIHATPKGLRHGFGIHAIRSGVPVNLVQRWLGHARLETTMIYLQALGSEEREIARRMWT
jgi:integrase